MLTDRHQLVDTKFHPPNLTQTNVSRDGILSALLPRPTKSVFMFAAAGFGKSTIMRQVFDRLTEDGFATAWLSLDERDSQPATFLVYFFELLTQAGIIEKAEILEQTCLSEGGNIERAFSLMNQAVSRVSRPTAIFLDDFHAIQNASILKEFSRFLDAKSSSVSVFLTSRTTPDLDLSRREMDGSFIWLDSANMKFSQIEAERFFDNALEKTIEPSDVSRVLSSTEGWPAGLQLASISLESSTAHVPAIASNYLGSSEKMTQYLYDNVMKKLPEDVQDFLLSTAPLNRFCSSMCRAVRGKAGNSALIQWLVEKNLFVVKLDDDGKWFRYHHLFSDFLNQMSRKCGRRSKSDICHKASRWCLENGFLDEAVSYLLEIRDYDEAAKLISDAAPRVARQKGDNITMIRWIETLPESYLTEYPEMMLDYAFSLSFTHSTEKAIEIVNNTRKLFQDTSDTPEEAPCRESYDTLAYADTVEALALAAKDDTEKSLEKIAETQRRWTSCDAVTLGVLANVAAYCHISNDRPGLALKETVNARMLGLQSKSSYVWVWADCLEVMAHCRTGDLAAVDGPLRRAFADVGTVEEDSLLRLMVHMLSADVAYLKGDIKKARSELALGTGFSASYGPLEPLLISHRVRAGCAAISGNWKRNAEVLERGQSLGLRNGLPRLTFSLISLEISSLALQEKDREARQVAEKWGVFDGSWSTRFRGTTESTESLVLVQKRIVAEVAVTEGAFDLAAKTIDDAVRRVRNRLPLPELVRLMILKAHALSNSDRPDDAGKEISGAARLAHSHGVVAPFLEFAKYARPLLCDVLDRRIAVDTPEDILAESPESRLLAATEPQTPNSENPNVDAETPLCCEDLTKREIELLQLIESGMTNAQIAASLFISVATVKWHLHNAFQKLGVRNRMGALKAARKVGLL
ncbi:LuxR C-terminal-related transcriptional regulator [uncultured Roseovarius sp.]|uniref:LuxR C-terminal-related transcriptional regulator n=1 Tax=uncultured Roseovarius sp. TaxID=293344 RepID=UPI0026109FE5|nr:LuxR C-terminal-related transcriptional regulator [uncultured Roseovarius sp.]